MRRVILCAVIVSAIHFGSIAQQKLSFRSLNYLGLLEGETGSAFQIQTINGLQRRGWFAGVGTGLDYYRYRSIPLFFSLSKKIGNQNRGFFISMDEGINFAWYKREKRWADDFTSSKFSPSLYWVPSIGYSFGLRNNKDAILIGIGYSYKHLKEKVERSVFCINPPCEPVIERYDYRLNRLLMRIGWQF
jgi:hypothetical protein